MEFVREAQYPQLRIRVQTERHEWLYQVHLAEITKEENDFVGGRFLHFVLAPQEHVVKVPAAYSEPAPVSLAKHYNSNVDHSHYLNWISENVFSPWSIKVWCNHVSHMEVEYSFASADDALMFKLTF